MAKVKICVINRFYPRPIEQAEKNGQVRIQSFDNKSIGYELAQVGDTIDADRIVIHRRISGGCVILEVYEMEPWEKDLIVAAQARKGLIQRMPTVDISNQVLYLVNRMRCVSTDATYDSQWPSENEIDFMSRLREDGNSRIIFNHIINFFEETYMHKLPPKEREEIGEELFQYHSGWKRVATILFQKIHGLDPSKN